jgi:hypothetical protein
MSPKYKYTKELIACLGTKQVGQRWHYRDQAGQFELGWACPAVATPQSSPFLDKSTKRL